VKQTIQVKQITIRVPDGVSPRGEDLARQVTGRIAAQSGRPIPSGIKEALATRLSTAQKGNH
jgi:hypothetical protein